MLGLDNLLQYYPPKLHGFKKGILREYIQYLMLQTIFSHSYSQKLCFIGGTSLRIGYDSQRFSEDLDFDNWGLSVDEFEKITNNIVDMLIGEGFGVTVKHIYKGAFHCMIKIPKLLYENNLGTMPTENLTIKIDTVAQGFNYEAQRTIIQKFGLVFPIRIADESTLLSMKFNAFFSRAKGRDVFDIVYLLGRTKSLNWGVLEKTRNITNGNLLNKKVLERINELDFEQLQKDVQPFLFDSNNQFVRLFPEIINNIKFE